MTYKGIIISLIILMMIYLFIGAKALFKKDNNKLFRSLKNRVILAALVIVLITFGVLSKNLTINQSAIWSQSSTTNKP